MKILLIILALLSVAILALGGLRLADLRADRQLRETLLDGTGGPAPSFEPAMLESLPEPVARFFAFAIAPGTPLRTTALIEMGGELSLGTKDDPGYQPMVARQVLAPPRGFLWQVRLRTPARITGSDALTPDDSWGRFRLLDLVPVARVSRDPDHRLSSFGRLVAEGLIWTPAAFLPEARAGWDSLEWQAIDAGTIALHVRHDGMEQRAELTIDAQGRPLQVVLERWSNENPDKEFRYQPFGGDLSEFQSFDGFTLPTGVSAGNHFGTGQYHPFFRAEVTAISFR